MTQDAALAEVRRLRGLLWQAEDEIASLRRDNARLRAELAARVASATAVPKVVPSQAGPRSLPGATAVPPR